ncbi:bifunctional homocysteine S-methyltransferase/methylenetetrahydrofolate reductase [Konateibacter massiliensis]|uniref:bifunctional homocysteine S-methyltransferase/methylenetetrahydrofolate reductase n=1 Tax=Konateibacter massiliensis TaxID=2002841 RepID=UPI000C152CD3|nr:bifunctional homocysteine S-methyltransferase/methylenetetrahydrofolate reductase [Konateibacter massiliensis]
MRVREYLEKKPFLFDGAMGTYYAEKYNGTCELANLEYPERILEIHREYIAAGCQAIKTNTFAANTMSLETDLKHVKEIIRAASQIALQAAKGSEIAVFGDMGPIPYTGSSPIEEYKKIIDTFLESGVENFLFETLGSDEFLAELSKYIKSKKEDSFILTQFAVTPDGFTRMGLSGKNILKRVKEIKEIDAVGFNCVSGAHHLYEYIKQFELSQKYFSIMPNAGFPTVRDNRTIFENSSDYFAETLQKTAELGVSILGGCCGTTPDYIRKTAARIEGVAPKRIEYKPSGQKAEEQKQKETGLMKKIRMGKKIIAVELDPPANAEIANFMEGAKRLKYSGVDAITIADCPLARARVDSSLLACKLKRELDITPIPHMTCRDRNINATKALLLGMNAEGVENVLVVTGDPVPSPLRDEIKTMFSFHSGILAKHISELNEEVFSSPFGICAALNVNVKNFDAQIKHAKRKIENGVTMLFTQPVLTEEAFENLKRAKEELDVKILGGIIPIVSHKNACFMNNEISGINVSQDIIDRYEDKTREEASVLAVDISLEVAKKITPYVDGYYIITPFNRVEIIEKIIQGIQSFN